MSEIIEAVKKLKEAIESNSDDCCTSVTVFFNCEGYNINQYYRTSDQLIESGVSMRNVRGEWIRD
jgi:hypothetical protein